MFAPSPRVFPRQIELRPWQVVDLLFPVEQRDYILQSVIVNHVPFPMSRLEARARRRWSHDWLPEKTRRHDMALVEKLRYRHTADAQVVQVFHKSYVFLTDPLPWHILARPDWWYGHYRYNETHLEPGTTLTIRFRNGRRPTTWRLLVHGFEMIERASMPTFAMPRLGE